MMHILKAAHMKKILPSIIALLSFVVYISAQAEEMYVSASLANVREQPNINAKLVAKLPINQKLNLSNKQDGWCEISQPNQATKGFLQCQLLSSKPTTLAQIELETANAVLAINRFTLKEEKRKDLSFVTNKYDELAPINALFKQLERHFYYSPSINTYQLYEDLIRYTENRFNENKSEDKNQPLADEVQNLIKTKAAQTIAMRTALSFNPAQNAYQPITKPITYTLTQLLKKRQGIIATDRVQPSYFKNGAWSFGWEGGRNLDVKVEKSGKGFEYKVGFDAYNLNALGAAVEMAKHYKSPVKMSFRYPKNDNSGLSQMSPNFEGAYEFGEVVTELPAYAITDNGLVKGTFKSASFAGDACWGEEGNTHAKFNFPKALEGTVHGFFVSSAPVDVNVAKVTINKKTTHQYLVLTHAIKAQVDLDGDSIADLRTLTSTQQGHFGMNESPFFAQLLPKQHTGFMPAGGLYESDIFSLEANHDGQWQTLSIYNITTCT